MQTMNQSLATLCLTRQITASTAAMGATSMRDELEQMLSRGTGVVAGAHVCASRGRRPGSSR